MSGAPTRRRVVHHFDDFSGVRRAERAAEHGEVLREHEHRAAVDRAEARDDAVTRQPLFRHAEVGRLMRDEAIELDEAAHVEQKLQAFARGQLALGVLLVDASLPRRLAAPVDRVLPSALICRIPLTARVLSENQLECEQYEHQTDGRARQLYALSRAPRVVSSDGAAEHFCAHEQRVRALADPAHAFEPTFGDGERALSAPSTARASSTSAARCSSSTSLTPSARSESSFS